MKIKKQKFDDLKRYTNQYNLTKKQREEVTRIQQKEEAKNYKKTYNDHWRNIIEDEHGNIDKHRMMKKLSDYYNFQLHIARIYTEMTGGVISDPDTNYHVIIEEMTAYTIEIT